MKKILILLGLVIFNSSISVNAIESNFSLQVKGNISNYNYEECNLDGNTLRLFKDGEYITDTTYSNNYFEENKLKQVGAFSLFTKLDLEPLDLSRYVIVNDSGEKYNLNDFSSQIDYPQKNFLLINNIRLFCEQEDLDTIMKEAFEEDKEKIESNEVSGFGYVNMYDDVDHLRELKILSSTAIEDVQIEIKNLDNGEILFERESLDLPYTTDDFRIIDFMPQGEYKITMNKKGFEKRILVVNTSNGVLEATFIPVKESGERRVLNYTSIDDTTSSSEISNEEVVKAEINVNEYPEEELAGIRSKVVLEGKEDWGNLEFTILVGDRSVNEGASFIGFEGDIIRIFIGGEQFFTEEFKNSFHSIDVSKESNTLLIFFSVLGFIIFLLIAYYFKKNKKRKK